MKKRNIEDLDIKDIIIKVIFSEFFESNSSGNMRTDIKEKYKLTDIEYKNIKDRINVLMKNISKMLNK